MPDDFREHGLQSCLDRRRAGVLLHITSLPGAGLNGELGPEAFHFVDFLAACGISVWQMLPVNPTGPDGSPYQTSSVHAGSDLLISLQPLIEAGWLEEDALAHQHDHHLAAKCAAIRRAKAGFDQHADAEDQADYQRFCKKQAHWLDDFALFQALQTDQRRPWWEWPKDLRDRQPRALKLVAKRLQPQIDNARFAQYLFFCQWHQLKQYANERGVKLFGDVPIFVAHDSAEVWAHPEWFNLDAEGQTVTVAGVPPDYFSATGQRWGNPLYRWDRMAEDGFLFWEQRLRTQLQLFDILRIDHFRGFEAYWEIPASEPDAVNGVWREAPGRALFDHLFDVFGELPLVAEDLGIITPAVNALRKAYRLPGMKVLQFAFSREPDNPYLPYKHGINAVAYTGTHDNDTTLGWYLSLDDDTRLWVDDFLGHSRDPMPWPLIRLALVSSARLAVLPMQDLLGLDGAHRMNLPGTTEGNWEWRMSWDQVPPGLAERMRQLLQMYGRLTS